ncbi:formamidopyrimidine-DNA glycosylase [mine drainage metagenome]|uniref:Formamidopyrimidine-DNA glycosylase n=1 Tax=mine drainage metagenome TaxID=410659 RepID=T0ZY96_9ZZZZ
MPELPEVETIRRALAPRVASQAIVALDVIEPRLRYRIPETLCRDLPGRTIQSLERRGKYLVFVLTGDCYLLVHLGMSGRLSLVAPETPFLPHEHWQLRLPNGAIRLRDPRRFSLLLAGSGSPSAHPLLRMLGPEPLDDAFTGAYWIETIRHRKAAIKTLLMDSRIVSGIGNIYANEALHRAGIHPNRPGRRLAAARLLRLQAMTRSVLLEALASGGSTLRDYRGLDGTPGEFSTVFRVYGREGEPCLTCRHPIRRIRTGQRSTFYCPHCQK